MTTAPMGRHAAGWWTVLPLLVAVAACSQTGVVSREIGEQADSADQIMLKMATTLTERGVLTSYVEADTAYVYQNQQVMDWRILRIRFLDAQGNEKSTLTARRGIYNMLSGKLDCRGDVIVQTTDGRHLRTQHLVYDKVSRRVESDTAFTYESATERGSGKSFKSDAEFRNLEIIEPKGFQTGKGVLLPRPGQ